MSVRSKPGWKQSRVLDKRINAAAETTPELVYREQAKGISNREITRDCVMKQDGQLSRLEAKQG